MRRLICETEVFFQSKVTSFDPEMLDSLSLVSKTAAVLRLF